MEKKDRIKALKGFKNLIGLCIESNNYILFHFHLSKIGMLGVYNQFLS